MEEKKAWVTSDTAKTMQATFICLAHNLSLFINDKLQAEEDVVYTHDIEKKQKLLDDKQKNLKKENIKFPSTWKIVLRVSQLTIKFYRWLRVCVRQEASWDEAVAALRRLYATF